MAGFRRYDLIARRYDTVSLERWLYAAPRARALDLLGAHPGDTVLDLGCGTGLNFPRLIAMVGPGGQVIGVDASACGPTHPPGYANSPGCCGPAGASLWYPSPGATAATSAAAANELAGLFTEAGFEHLRTEVLDLDPPTACVLGQVTPADDAELIAHPTARS